MSRDVRRVVAYIAASPASVTRVAELEQVTRPKSWRETKPKAVDRRFG